MRNISKAGVILTVSVTGAFITDNVVNDNWAGAVLCGLAFGIIGALMVKLMFPKVKKNDSSAA